MIIGAFKAYHILRFFNAVLLQDFQSLLHSPDENSKTIRQLHLTSLECIQAAKVNTQAYIAKAIAVEKSGLKVNFKKKATLEYPEELTIKFEDSSAFKEVLQALNPGCRYGYLLHFSTGNNPRHVLHASRSTTNASSPEKE